MVGNVIPVLSLKTELTGKIALQAPLLCEISGIVLFGLKLKYVIFDL